MSLKFEIILPQGFLVLSAQFGAVHNKWGILIMPNKRYTPIFKQLVVETMKEEHLSMSETMRRFKINVHGIIESWK